MELTLVKLLIEYLFFFLMIGVFLNRKNFIVLIMLFELMMIVFCVIFCLIAIYFNDSMGLLAVIMLLTLSAVDTALVISLLVSYYKHKGDINILNTVEIKNKLKKK